MDGFLDLRLEVINPVHGVVDDRLGAGFRSGKVDKFVDFLKRRAFGVEESSI